MSDKAELIKEGTDGVTKLTNAANNKTLAFCLVGCIILIFLMYFRMNSLTDQLINTNNSKNDVIIEEVRKQVQPIQEQQNKMQKKVDTITLNADSTLSYIKDRIRK